MLQCLKQNKNSEVMDPKCKQMITKRQITQNTGIVCWKKPLTCLPELLSGLHGWKDICFILLSFVVICAHADFIQPSSRGSVCFIGSTLYLKLLPHKLILLWKKNTIFPPKSKLIGGTMSSRKFVSNLFQSVLFCNLKGCMHALMKFCHLSPLDYRLNPVLRKACKADIPKFCQNILNRAKDDTELEGQVISCLKLKYADQVSRAGACEQETLQDCTEKPSLNNESNLGLWGVQSMSQAIHKWVVLQNTQVKMQCDWFLKIKVTEWVNDFLRLIASLSRLRGPNSSDNPGIGSWLSAGSPTSDALFWRGRRSGTQQLLFQDESSFHETHFVS